MKSRGVKLSKHYQQTFDYWLNLVPHRPPYVVLCNFDEFWIYDFNTQLQEPVDRIPVADLPARHAALNFLFPRAFQPLFGHNWVQVTREAAKDVAHAFNSLVVARRRPRPRPPLHPPMRRRHVRRGHRPAARRTSSPACWTNAAAAPPPTTSSAACSAR